MLKILATRQPWVTALLSLIFPGLGHIYCGCWVRGVLWFMCLYAILLLSAYFTDVSNLPVFYTVFFTHGLFYVFIIIDSYKRAYKIQGLPYDHRPRLPVYIVAAVVIWFVESTYLNHRNDLMGVENYRLASGSMTPRLQEGDYVVVDTRVQSLRNFSVGEVVVFQIDGEKAPFVKRIAAVAEDLIEIRLGKVYRNGVFDARLEVLDQRRRRQGSQSMSTIQVPLGEVFMLGDWRDNSKDSRARGTVPMDNILGKVTAVWFSTDLYRIGRLNNGLIIRQ